MITTKGRIWVLVFVFFAAALFIGQAARHNNATFAHTISKNTTAASLLSNKSNETVVQESIVEGSHTCGKTENPVIETPASLPKPKAEPGRRYAFATFLAAPDGGNKLDSDEDDGYFVSARVLAYQLLHNPETRCKGPIDFIVLVTKDVPQSKRQSLENDGAIVLEVPKLVSTWLTPDSPRYQDVLTKLRLFAMTDYDLICFVDADHMIIHSLEEIFDDPASKAQKTRPMPPPKTVPENMLEHDESLLPESYILAAHSDIWADHKYPPEEDRDYLNIGFFVIRPDMLLFQYYEQLMAAENKGLFDTGLPEQDLINFAHRRDKGGRMPWQSLWYGWNINHGNENDYKQGVKSMHGKFWNPGLEDAKMSEKWMVQRGEMYGFWKGKNLADQEWQWRNRKTWGG